MTLIYVPVEVPEDELGDFLARTTARQLGGEVVNDGGTSDPWADEPAQTYVSPGTSTGPAHSGSADYAPRPSHESTSSAPSVPSCAHGPMKFIEGGYSKRTGKPYKAFYACQAPQGQAQCKGVTA